MLQQTHVTYDCMHKTHTSHDIKAPPLPTPSKSKSGCAQRFTVAANLTFCWLSKKWCSCGWGRLQAWRPNTCRVPMWLPGLCVHSHLTAQNWAHLSHGSRASSVHILANPGIWTQARTVQVFSFSQRRCCYNNDPI